MVNVINRVALTLELNHEIREQCYPTVPELFRMITESISAEATGAFGDVVISNNIPDSDSNYKMHILPNGDRTDFTARFNIYGEWKPWYFLVPNQIITLPGTIAVPDGFEEIGRYKTSLIPIEDTSGSASLPDEFVVAKFIGYA